MASTPDWRAVPLFDHFKTFQKTRNYYKSQDNLRDEVVACATTLVNQGKQVLIFVHTKKPGRAIKEALREKDITSDFHCADLKYQEKKMGAPTPGGQGLGAAGQSALAAQLQEQLLQQREEQQRLAGFARGTLPSYQGGTPQLGGGGATATPPPPTPVAQTPGGAGAPGGAPLTHAEQVKKVRKELRQKQQRRTLRHGRS